MQNISEADQLKILNVVYGFDAFRTGQAKVIDHVLKGEDAFALWATGAGKSLCFQFPPLIWQANRKKGIKDQRKCVVVVSPLISLMQDQVESINRRNNPLFPFRAVSLSASASDADFQDANNGKFQVIFCTPERITSSWGRSSLYDMVKSGMIGLFAIDEAHCVSKWGHDFRPDFREMNLRQRFPSVPILALTATATQKTKMDIVRALEIKNPYMSFTTFLRDNLEYHCLPECELEPGLHQLVDDIADKKLDGVAIIYCVTTKKVEQILMNIQHKMKLKNIPGHKARKYHGKMEKRLRSQNLTDFITGKVLVIVATIAFGMGIDKSDIRRVIHVGPTKSIEAYYQQTGRAGRDGDLSHCYMYANGGSFNQIKGIISMNRAHSAELDAELRLVDTMKSYTCMQNGCRKKHLLKYFGEEVDWTNCDSCDLCARRGDEFEADLGKWVWMACKMGTDFNFGMGVTMWTDIIRGSKAQKILQKRHHLRSHMYGKGEVRSKDWWKAMFTWLENNGYFRPRTLVADASRRFPVTVQEVTAKGRSFVKKANSFEQATLVVNNLPSDLKVRPKRISVAPGSFSSRSRRSNNWDHFNEKEAELYGCLREFDREQASKGNAANVFSNFTLQHMTDSRPDTAIDLYSLPGMALGMFNNHKDAYLNFLRQKCQELGLNHNHISIKQGLSEEEAKLAEELKIMQAKIETESRKPIISVRMLGKIAKKKPQDEDAFFELPGMSAMLDMFQIEETLVLKLLPVVQKFCQANGISVSTDEPPPLADGVPLKEVKDCPAKYQKKIGNAALGASHRFAKGESITEIATLGRVKPVKETTIINYIALVAMDQPLDSGLAEKLVAAMPSPLSKEWESQLYGLLRKLDATEINTLSGVRKLFAEIVNHEVDWGILGTYIFKFLYLRAKGKLDEYKLQSPGPKKRRSSMPGSSPKRQKLNSVEPSKMEVESSGNSVENSPAAFRGKVPSPTVRKKPTLGFGEQQKPFGGKAKRPSFGLGKKRSSFSFGAKTTASPRSTTSSKSPKKTPVFGGKKGGKKKTPVFGARKTPVFGVKKKTSKSSPFGAKKKTSKPSPFGASKVSSSEK